MLTHRRTRHYRSGRQPARSWQQVRRWLCVLGTVPSHALEGSGIDAAVWLTFAEATSATWSSPGGTFSLGSLATTRREHAKQLERIGKSSIVHLFSTETLYVVSSERWAPVQAQKQSNHGRHASAMRPVAVVSTINVSAGVACCCVLAASRPWAAACGEARPGTTQMHSNSHRRR